MNHFCKMIVAFLALGAIACGGAGSASKPAKAEAAVEKQPRKPLLHQFQPPQPPIHLDREGQLDYLLTHFWDGFDFADTAGLATIDTAVMLQRMGLFGAWAAQRPLDRAPIDSLMRRATTSRPMLDLFLYLSEAVFHDPNSPLRNDEHYIPILEAQLSTDFYDEYERIAPEYDLQLARQNRIGYRANDFRYATADGRRRSLYDLQADYVLLFFNNPDCAMCKELREQIGQSPRLTELIASGRMQVLALYPDEDLTAWKAYRPNIPASWINSYDPGCRIREENLYNLNAIPSLYLLDRQKKVLVKDAASIAEIEQEL